MGFQHMKPIVLEAASRKGGKWKIRKGFGTNHELAVEAGSRGGIAKRENRNKETVISEETDTSIDKGHLEKVLGDIGEEDIEWL